MKKEFFNHAYTNLSSELVNIGKQIPPEKTIGELEKDQQHDLRLFFISYAQSIEQEEGFSVSGVAAALMHMFFLGHEWTVRHEEQQRGLI